MSFYNPNLKTPDIGQGLEGLMAQLLPMLMMKKYMGGKPETSLGQTPLPRDNPGMGAIPMGGPDMSQMGSGAGGGMDPAQLQKLMQLLQTLKMGGGGGMMGGGL
jgi:hypothetical protein